MPNIFRQLLFFFLLKVENDQSFQKYLMAEKENKEEGTSYVTKSQKIYILFIYWLGHKWFLFNYQ